MRTTLTLDEDMAAKLKAEMRRSGRSFKETVNEFLRLGLNTPRAKSRKRLVVKPFNMGALCTTDRDFTRFPGLRMRNPLEA